MVNSWSLSFVRRYGILWDNELAMAAEQNGQDLEAFLNLTSGNRMMLLEILHRNRSRCIGSEFNKSWFTERLLFCKASLGISLGCDDLAD